jgi:AAA family ATPase
MYVHLYGIQLVVNRTHTGRQVTHDAFVSAAKGIRKQITPEVISQYERWRDQITI